MTTRTDLFNAIMSHDAGRIYEIIENVDINFKSPEGTVLSWAITGAMYNSRDPVGKGDYDTLKLLLDHRANPNYEHMIYSPIYYATKEGRHDMIVLLINYGADPNSYDPMPIKNEKGDEVCECKTPLIRAIENHSYLCVEALIHRGALFNNVTLDYAMAIRDKLEETRKQSAQDYLDYENAKNIYLSMKNVYDSHYETFVDDYLKNNSMTFKKMNYFVGFEK